MYKKILVFGMVLLIMFLTPLPSSAENYYFYKPNSETIYNYGTNPYFNDTNPTLFKYSFVIKSSSNRLLYGTTNYPLIYISNNKYKSDSPTNTYSYKSYTIVNSLPIADQSFFQGKLFSWRDYNMTNPTTSYQEGEILWSSHDIKDINGNTIINGLGDIVTPTNFDGRITLPANDGYRDNGTTFSFWHWYQLPTDVDSTDVEINPYVDDLKTTYFSPSITLHQKIANTNKWNLNLNLTVYEYGQHTYKIVFKQKSTGNIIGTLTRTFEALEGFIDENGDGLDDRTNQPPYTPLEPPNGDVNSPEWDGTILGFFTFLINSIKYYVQAIVSGINVTISTIGQVPSIMGTILNFPPELTSLLILGVTCTIILAIFRR